MTIQLRQRYSHPMFISYVNVRSVLVFDVSDTVVISDIEHWRG